MWNKVFWISVVMSLMTSVQASEIVKIVWPFAPSPAYTNLLRTIENSNKNQDKYVFVTEIKQGAGGSIAANYALQHNYLVASSVSFILRPLTEPNAHDISSFTPVHIQATNVPLVMVSKKYQTISELNAASKPTVGISARGGITEFIANAATNGKAEIIGFKNFNEAIPLTIGGHVDASVTTLGEVKTQLDAGNLYLLGSTGTHSPKSFKSQKITGLDRLVSNYVIYAPATMDKNQLIELNEILGKASDDPYVKQPFELENPIFVRYNINKLQEWYTNEISFWKTFLKK